MKTADMNSHDRAHAALEKKPVDRPCVWLWLHPETKQALSRVFEVPQGRVEAVLGHDIRQIWVNNNYAMEGILHAHDGESHVDQWGIQWTRKHGFNQITSSPLEDATAEELLAYAFPYDHLDSLMQPMNELVQTSEGYFVGCDVSPCAFEMYNRLRGMENALLDLVLETDTAEKIIARCVDFSLYLSEYALNHFALDWLWTGDDVAAQQGMLMSPELWRSMIKPHMARLFSVAKTAGVYVAYHCCGALYPIIPDLIEIGLDVLNPVQPNCPHMNPKELKKEFGDHLAFMGGVDTQELVPHGDAVQVKRETEKLVQDMTSDGGGYILAASHLVPPETPLENIFAIYEAIGLTREYFFDRAADIRHANKGY